MKSYIPSLLPVNIFQQKKKKGWKRCVVENEQQRYWVYWDSSPSIGMKTRMLKNVGKIYSLALNVYIEFSHNIKIDVEYKKSR